MDDSLLQQPLLHVLIKGLQPGLTTLDHPVSHGGPAQLHALSGPDLLLTGKRQSIRIFLRHDIGYGRRRSQAVLHKGYRRLYIGKMGKAGVLFAMVTGIGHSIVGQQLHLTGNYLQLMTDKLLANGLECSSALAADTLVLRQFQQDFFLGQVCGHLFKGTLLLSGMSLDSKGFLGGFFCFVVLLLLRLIEQTHLVFTKDIGCLLTGLAKPGSLGVGKDLIHMIQLALQFVDLSLLSLDLTLLVLNRTL